MKTINVAAAIIRDGERIFATQRGYGPYKDGWEYPGGKIEPGESPQDALKREIMEELDTVIEVGEKLMTVEYDYPDFHLHMDCFWAQVVEGNLVLSDGHYEHSGKALYGDDGHMTRLDIVSPVSGQPGYHHHEWWNEREGYGHGIHEDH